MEQEGIRTGEYKHYKGNRYEVLGVGQRDETGEKFVVYRALFDGYGLWIRLVDEFKEEVTVNGEKVPRFQYVGK